MNLRQLEHILRAGGSIAGCRDMVIIGSQALAAALSLQPDPVQIERVTILRLRQKEDDRPDLGQIQAATFARMTLDARRQNRLQYDAVCRCNETG